MTDETKRKATVISVSLLVVLVALSALSVNARPTNDLSEMRRADIVVGHHTIHSVLAVSNVQQQAGFARQESIPEHLDGMLFLFDEPQQSPFWMQQVRFPLDLLWIDDQDTVIGLERLEPCRRPWFCPQTEPPGPYQAVLEVRSGTFNRNVIGEHVTFSLGG